MKIVRTNGKNKDFIKLCEMLDDNLNKIAGEKKQREIYEQYNKLDDIKDVILIYIDNKAIGCGSFKFYENNVAEVKRVFILEDYRGKGFSKIIMNKLEESAKDKGFKKLILETGKPLVEAMSLYIKLGYKVIDNYGQYKNIKESICMEKKLK